MNIQLHYGSSVISLPGAVSKAADRATATDLRVILAICGDPALDTTEKIAESTGISVDEVAASVAFWRGAGILTMTSGKKSATNAKASEKAVPTEAPGTNDTKIAPEQPAKKAASSASLPRYTSEELANLLESRKDTASFLAECQNVWGKMFNVHEHNIILGLTDYLGLEWDYVLTLLAFCGVEQDKRGIRRSLRFVETAAFNFYDEGVTDLPALQTKLRRMEQMEEVEVQLRRMFGMGDRALTPGEKKKFSAWLYEYNFGMDMITRAYEITVDAKGSPNLKYMDAILANWNRDGIRTPEDVNKANQAFHADKSRGSKAASKESSNASHTGSFDTDDFFTAALTRSLGEDFVKRANSQGDT